MLPREELAENVFSFVPLMLKRLMKELPQFEIPRKQLELLFHISRNPGRPMNHYSEKMMISRPSLTVLSMKLIRQELCVRILDENDRRLICLDLTEKGRRYLKEYKTAMKQHIMERFAALPDSDVKRLNLLLLEMQSILHQMDRPTGSGEDQNG